MDIPWILIALLVGGLVTAGLAVIFIMAGRKRQQGIALDYRTYFVIGITWLLMGGTMGAVTGSTAYLGMGVIGLAFLVIGLANRDKWQAPPAWPDLSAEEQRARMILIAVGLLGLLVLGVLVFLLAVR
ncbi:MAG: hypothetical protein JXA78_19015 [Anaerolineales bacterium]|nr:hypothetical protein [Anaerolineales bacterium]